MRIYSIVYYIIIQFYKQYLPITNYSPITLTLGSAVPEIMGMQLDPDEERSWPRGQHLLIFLVWMS